MTNVEALKTLYEALGGESADVENASTIVDVLNAIAAMFDGESDAAINPDAIANIAAVAGNIGGGGAELASLIDRSIQSFTIPDGVEKIGSGAFLGCVNLTAVSIPESVTAIDAEAFSGCTSLPAVTIPDGVTSLGNNAFSGCIGLTSITIPSSIKNISASAFGGCMNLSSVTISDGVESIGDSVFGGCSSLTSIAIPSSVTSIGNSAFGGSGITAITINKPQNSITGAPWGAQGATVEWTG